VCLILFAYRAHPLYPLVLAANRDEFYDRPSAPADFWPEHPGILGGRDLSAGGTWLGIHRSGKLAAITNYRDGKHQRVGNSRGHLVSEFLRSHHNAVDHIASSRPSHPEYGGFNLLLFDSEGVHYASNRATVEARVEPGIHGLSNHLLDTPWPKVQGGKTALARLLAERHEAMNTGLFEILADRSEAAEHQLPRTGISPDWEKKLSAPFIHSPGYGTRASTVITLNRRGRLDFRERSFDANGQLVEERRFVVEDFVIGVESSFDEEYPPPEIPRSQL